MRPDLLQELGRAARERTPLVLRRKGDGRVGVLPLWPMAGSHGFVDVVAVVWRPYRLERIESDAWTIDGGDNQGPAPTVPPVDLSRRVRLHRFDDEAGRPLEDIRRIIETAALAERFKLELTIGYRPEGRPVEERTVGEVVCRGECMVVNDRARNAARSFRFDRTHWIDVRSPEPPTWNGADYEGAHG